MRSAESSERQREGRPRMVSKWSGFFAAKSWSWATHPAAYFSSPVCQ